MHQKQDNRVLVGEDGIKERWKKYFNKLYNEYPAKGSIWCYARKICKKSKISFQKVDDRKEETVVWLLLILKKLMVGYLEGYLARYREETCS